MWELDLYLKAFDSLGGVWSLLLACVEYFQKKHLKWLSWLYSIALLSPVWLCLFFSFHRHLSWNKVIVINVMEAWKGLLRRVPTNSFVLHFFFNLILWYHIWSCNCPYMSFFITCFSLVLNFLCSTPLPVHILRHD